MRTEDFDYDLPEDLIAQEPAAERDGCRLLVVDRRTGALDDRVFRDIVDFIEPGDVLVANETRVMPARLLGTKRGSGGQAEVFLLREMPGFDDALVNESATWEVLVRPGKRLKPGAIIDFADGEGGVALHAEIVDWAEGGKGGRVARLTTERMTLDEALHAVGHTPLPPYIKNYVGDEELYQTVYSTREASAAAPTAGLHFTPDLISRIEEKGARWLTVELEVGIDTFRIVDEEDPTEHRMHTERYSVSSAVIEEIEAAHERGSRVIAVGTTSVRSLESAWDGSQGCLVPREGAATSLFILPGYAFHAVDAMITNFHVPRSTLMMLVSSFATRDIIMGAYRHAIDERYRMLSFGDAMLIR